MQRDWKYTDSYNLHLAYFQQDMAGRQAMKYKQVVCTIQNFKIAKCHRVVLILPFSLALKDSCELKLQLNWYFCIFPRITEVKQHLVFFFFLSEREEEKKKIRFLTLQGK